MTEARGEGEGRRVAVVIPTWNEAAAIGAVVREIPRALAAEVIVADGAREAALAAGARVLDTGRGYGRACTLGAAAAPADCDVIASMDGADRADLLPLLARPIFDGTHGSTIASRTRGERGPGSMSWHRPLASWLAGRAMGALPGAVNR